MLGFSTLHQGCPLWSLQLVGIDHTNPQLPGVHYSIHSVHLEGYRILIRIEAHAHDMIFSMVCVLTLSHDYRYLTDLRNVHPEYFGLEPAEGTFFI